MGIEPTSSAWKADILADVLYPQLQNALYHNFAQMSSMNLGSATVKAVAFLLWEAPAFCCVCAKRKAPYFKRSTVLFVLVEITGIEPVTSCMPCKRSPS